MHTCAGHFWCVQHFHTQYVFIYGQDLTDCTVYDAIACCENSWLDALIAEGQNAIKTHARLHGTYGNIIIMQYGVDVMNSAAPCSLPGPGLTSGPNSAWVSTGSAKRHWLMSHAMVSVGIT